MGADGHVKIYRKEDFTRTLSEFLLQKEEKGINVNWLRSYMLRVADKYYSFEEYVIRYVEYGTETWDTNDWLVRLLKWHLQDRLNWTESDVHAFLDELELQLQEIELKDIMVWT